MNITANMFVEQLKEMNQKEDVVISVEKLLLLLNHYKYYGDGTMEERTK